MSIGGKVLKSVLKYEASKATGGLSESVGGLAGSITGGRVKMNTGSNIMKAKNIGGGISSMKDKMDSMNNMKERNMPKHANYIEDYKKGLASAGALASVAIGVAGARKLHSRMETESVWRRLKQEAPELVSDPKARENFEVLQKFSPDIASNITTARSYMQRMAHANMTPHEFVKDLTTIQKTRESSGMGAAIQQAASGARFDFGGSARDEHKVKTDLDRAKLDHAKFKYQKDIDKAKFKYQEDIDNIRFDNDDRRYNFDVDKFEWQKNRTP